MATVIQWLTDWLAELHMPDIASLTSPALGLVALFLVLSFTLKYAWGRDGQDNKRDKMWSDLHTEQMKMSQANSAALLQVSVVQAVMSQRVNDHIADDKAVLLRLETALAELHAKLTDINRRLDHDTNASK